MTLSNSMLLAIQEIERKVEALPLGATVEEKLLVAMRVARHHWLVTDEEARFRAAIGAVMLHSDPETKERLEQEVRTLRAVGAATEGVPVDLGAVFDDLPSEPIGLLCLWEASADGASQ